MSKKITVIIVNWNVREALRRNLARLFSLSCPIEFEVIVIDNASTDGSALMVREEFPQVRLVMNDWNAGFAYANNQGLRVAKGEVVILLNPDMHVKEGALERTYERLNQDHSIGIVGGKLITAEGEIFNSVRRNPGFKDQFAILSKWAHLRPGALDHYLHSDFDYSRTQEVDHVRGAYFAFRRDLVDVVGLMDDGFFLWFEEVDYCMRVKEAGYKIMYCADIMAEDGESKSFAQRSTVWKQRVFSASASRYFRKWHPWWQWLLISAMLPYAIATGLVVDAGLKVRRRNKEKGEDVHVPNKETV